MAKIRKDTSGVTSVFFLTEANVLKCINYKKYSQFSEANDSTVGCKSTPGYPSNTALEYSHNSHIVFKIKTANI